MPIRIKSKPEHLTQQQAIRYLNLESHELRELAKLIYHSACRLQDAAHPNLSLASLDKSAIPATKQGKLIAHTRDINREILVFLRGASALLK